MVAEVLVTGGSGVLGRLVVARLAAQGHGVRVLSRGLAAAGASRGANHGWAFAVGDLRDGSGLRGAVDGVDVVVHCASDPHAAQEVDVAGTARLIQAAEAIGNPHLVYVSIVGVDQIPLSYYRAKTDAENLVANSVLPWTIQRATQFHPFVADMVKRWSRAPILLTPSGFRFQPVDPAEVADRLCADVATGPAGRAPDVGGPEVRTFADLARTWMQIAGHRRPMVSVPVPGGLGRAFRSGANLCPNQAVDSQTWEQYLLASLAGRR